jgi:hypothetical protein
MIGTGLDTKGLAVPEVAYLRRAAEYRSAIEGFSAGTPDGVTRWLLFSCSALEAGASEARSIADSVGQ